MGKFVVSARKYRPDTFESVVGQSHISDTLKNAIKNNHLAHAFLFCGPRGVGKTTCARILAKTINCQNPTSDMEACGECDSCKSFQEGASLNIYELDAASNNAVDDIRRLIEQVRYTPQSGTYKIYIIDEVHMLSQAAFNAFLKTLEEPPSYAKFILATTEKHKIIPTILSRCQIFDFHRISVDSIVEHLQNICAQESIHAELDALYTIAQKADGALRDALSIFDRIVSFSGKTISYQDVISNLNILDYDYFFKISDCILTEDVSGVLGFYNEIAAKGFDGDDFILGLSEHLRNLLVCKDPSTVNLMDLTDGLKSRYIEQSKNLKSNILVSALNICNQCDVGYKASKNKRLHVEMALIKMCYIGAAITLATGSQDGVAKKKTSVVAPTSPSQKSESSSPSKQESVQVIPESQNLNKEAAVNQTVETENSSAQSLSSEKKQPVIRRAKSKMSFKLDAVKEDVVEPEKEEEARVIDETIEINERLLKTYWKNYAVSLTNNSEKGYMFAMLTKHEPRPKKFNVFEIDVENVLERDQLLDQKLEVLTFMRKKLGIPSLEMDINVVEKEGDVIQAYTPRDKFRIMAENNPELSKLVDRFDMEIDY